MTFPNALSVDGSIDDGFAVLTVAGTIDLATADILETELKALLEDQPRALVMDLEAVDFLASVGIQILVDTHNKFSQGCFVIVATDRVVTRPLALTHLDDVLRIVPSLTDARLVVDDVFE